MRKTAKAKPRWPAEDDEMPPRDPHALRLALVRRIARFLNRWRTCPERACRRARRCESARLTCTTLADRRPLDPRKRAILAASIQKALKREMARRAQANAPSTTTRNPPLAGGK